MLAPLPDGNAGHPQAPPPDGVSLLLQEQSDDRIDQNDRPDVDKKPEFPNQDDQACQDSKLDEGKDDVDDDERAQEELVQGRFEQQPDQQANYTHDANEERVVDGAAWS